MPAPPKNAVSSPLDTVRLNGDSLPAHLPRPHLPHRNLSLQALAATGRRQIRPLPQPPRNTSSPGARPLPRRRVTGGCFVNVTPEPAPPKPKTYGFYVCNPSDSPISPQFPHSSLEAEKSAHPVNIIPATPLPTPTTGPNFRSHANSSPPVLPRRPEIPFSEPPSLIRTVKRHRRFGASVGSVPATALAELRGMGEGKAPSRSMAPPVSIAEKESDSSSSEDEDEDEEALDEEDYSWVVETATRGVRPKRSRGSFNWVQDLGGDRWIADRYSSILRAL
ncbi:hypothetical protein B0H11DRAFT_2282928 [Mycena galericulata]|nr:hypothetical protein B0H11DRAFT_2282928 [Mycena galericulata]